MTSFKRNPFQIPEKQFLLEIAVRALNFQTGSNLKVEDMVIYSVPPAETFRYGWEINRNIPGDLLRIHLYANIEKQNNIQPYTIELKPQFRDGQLGDETYVFRIGIDEAHVLYDGYKFAWMDVDYQNVGILVQVDRAPITLTDGSFIALV